MCLCTVEKQGPTFGYEGLYFVNSVEQPWRCIFGTLQQKILSQQESIISQSEVEMVQIRGSRLRICNFLIFIQYDPKGQLENFHSNVKKKEVRKK